MCMVSFYLFGVYAKKSRALEANRASCAPGDDLLSLLRSTKSSPAAQRTGDREIASDWRGVSRCFLSTMSQVAEAEQGTSHCPTLTLDARLFRSCRHLVSWEWPVVRCADAVENDSARKRFSQDLAYTTLTLVVLSELEKNDICVVECSELEKYDICVVEQRHLRRGVLKNSRRLFTPVRVSSCDCAENVSCHAEHLPFFERPR